MMAAVRATVLRVSSASTAQHSPAQATAALSGQWISASGRPHDLGITRSRTMSIFLGSQVREPSQELGVN
jgi:hypothetical protein